MDWRPCASRAAVFAGRLAEGGDGDDNSSRWPGVLQKQFLAGGCSLSRADIPDRLCLALGSFCASLRSARHLQTGTSIRIGACRAVVVVHDTRRRRQEHHGLRAALRRAGDRLHAAAIRNRRAADRARPSKLNRRDEMSKYVIAYLGGKQMPNPQDRAAHMDRWKAWVDGLGSAMVNRGT